MSQTTYAHHDHCHVGDRLFSTCEMLRVGMSVQVSFSLSYCTRVHDIIAAGRCGGIP